MKKKVKTPEGVIEERRAAELKLTQNTIITIISFVIIITGGWFGFKYGIAEGVKTDIRQDLSLEKEVAQRKTDDKEMRKDITKIQIAVGKIETQATATQKIMTEVRAEQKTLNSNVMDLINLRRGNVQ